MKISVSYQIVLGLVLSLIINGNLISSNISYAVGLDDNLIPSNILYSEGFNNEAYLANNQKNPSTIGNNYNSLEKKSTLGNSFVTIPDMYEKKSILNNLNSDMLGNEKGLDNKYVILMFDRGYNNIFSTAKPILDKYGFKASIFIACDYIENGEGMNWNQVRQLSQDGYDIQSHGLEHKRLADTSSYNEIENIISGGKNCLEAQGFNPTIFQAPYNQGGDDPIIIETIGKYFDLAFTGHAELMFLNCDGWENFGYDQKNYHGTTDCSPFFSDGSPTPTNKLSIKEWSHDRQHYKINKDDIGEPHGPEVSKLLYDKFVKIVNDQSFFNKSGQVNAIPIIGYHEITTDDEIATSPELFDLEMKYLYDNGFKVITLSDLGYDEEKERFQLKNINT